MNISKMIFCGMAIGILVGSVPIEGLANIPPQLVAGVQGAAMEGVLAAVQGAGAEPDRTE